ncbi:hypothetical protein E3E26_08630 [Thermococcus sp. LS1]|uniref:hypothetical protein n=1 Tax=Thermococcus sp. LS1 TaxID=1638259 RepID=UPI00143C059D|nr:hypothetical protein [Thermococcus sp. LS1]NJD99842.1 hypothetical protein [Thermococcus sp. LS1]
MQLELILGIIGAVGAILTVAMIIDRVLEAYHQREKFKHLLTAVINWLKAYGIYISQPLEDLEPSDIKKALNQVVEDIEKLNSISDDLRIFRGRIKTLPSNLRSFIQEKYLSDLLNNSRVTLTVEEFYQFWTDLLTQDEDKVIFIRATSRIDPKFWLNPEMQIYQKRQFERIKELSQPTYAKNAQEIVEKTIRRALEHVTHPSFKEIDVNDLLKKIDPKVFFERIFLYSPGSNGVLSEALSSQVQGNISVLVLKLNANERPTPARPQDFGVIITEKGNVFTMYLDLDENNTPMGGYITFNNFRPFCSLSAQLFADKRKI